MFYKILTVNKQNVISEMSVKQIIETELYKKSGIKSKKSFGKICQWTLSNGNKISVFGKTEGIPYMKSDFNMPLPISNITLYGTCVIICENSSLTKEMWDNYIDNNLLVDYTIFNNNNNNTTNTDILTTQQPVQTQPDNEIDPIEELEEEEYCYSEINV